MSTKYNRTLSSIWLFLFSAILCIIRQSYVDSLPTPDEFIFGPKPKGTIKTIKALEVGDIIDCVDIYKQPAFDNPPIKILKMPPRSYSAMFNKTSNPQPLLIQSWTKFGKCPKGTIPIKRTSDYNVTFHRKYDNAPKHHEYATIKHHFNNGPGRGGDAYFNTWTPRVMTPLELSLSLMWAVAGTGEDLNTVEAGWMVYPRLFHDAVARFFIYWSRDNYRKGCYNLMCPNGFVQYNNEIAIGGAIEVLSVYGEEQAVISIGLTMSEVGDWWLGVGGNFLGYFPRQLFTTLGNGADLISYGGEIVNLAIGGHHTTTQMGSGHLAAEGYKKACYISDIKVQNGNFAWVHPNLEVHLVTKPLCYDLIIGPANTTMGPYIYFGGPGFSQKCQ